MRHHAAHRTDHGRTGRSHLAGPRSAVLIATVLLMTACSHSGSTSPGVAGAGSAGATSPSGGATKASALAYSQCMRGHGIKDFPDPGSNGEIALDANGPGSDLDPNNSQYKAANTACKSLLPPQQAKPAGLKEANLKYAKCMRGQGISDFPDPKADGTLQIQVEPGSDLDPDNPRYKAADKACKHYQLNGGAGSSVTSEGAGS